MSSDLDGLGHKAEMVGFVVRWRTKAKLAPPSLPYSSFLTEISPI
jgi:hypothetical protein